MIEGRKAGSASQLTSDETTACGPDSRGDERRTATRYIAAVVARLRRGLRSNERTALTRDISVSGALVLTRAPLQIGDEVELDLLLGSEEGDAVQVPGRVVRVEKLSSSERQMWAAKAAVEFDRAIDDSEPNFQAIASSQLRTGLSQAPPKAER